MTSSWQDTFWGDLSGADVTAYGTFLKHLHAAHDAIAAMRYDRDTVAQLTDELRAVTERLAPLATDEAGQVHGRVPDLKARGHAMFPPTTITERSEDRLAGTVTFGRWFMGGRMAVHGGAITMLFDELLGMFGSIVSDGVARTVRVDVQFRAITPIDTELGVEVGIDRIEGRKVFVHGRLTHGDLLCAEADALCVTLLPGQQ